MQNVNNMRSTPIQTQKSVRRDVITTATSGRAGEIIPLSMIPLHREDGVHSSDYTLMVKMSETAQPLMNGVSVQVNAHFVPMLAMDRFHGMDSFNKSYAGLPDVEGGDIIPFFKTHPFSGGAQAIYKSLGMHEEPAFEVNTAYKEAYNLIVNFRRKQRSKSLPLRTFLEGTLAPAFWNHPYMQHIVPDFDQASIDGEVALTVLNGQLPVKGIGFHRPAVYNAADEYNGPVNATNEGPLERNMFGRNVGPDSNYHVVFEQSAGGDSLGDMVFAELQENGITISLANIDLAKKTAAFARIREQMQGIDDDHIVDLLMQGIRVEETHLENPILLAQQTLSFGFGTQYASDAGNLDESVTRGGVVANLKLRVPATTTGGIIVITAEVTPEQLFERQRDYYFAANSVEDLPNYMRDYLDPEKVAVVKNSHVDVSHSDPDTTFGYAPLNHEWMRNAPRLGGKFYRPDVDAIVDEERQRFWAVETIDPLLTEDFFLCTDMHQKVFSDTESDPFEFIARGVFNITGNTVFGAALREATDDYDQIMAEVDTTKIDKTA